ncbi:MAG: FIST C-terminal domain-containing protein [Chitinivibrionales bacterium]|nr:FIST C-terminal domain-containing protein [Chitinivibrionales bacterium]
MAIKTVYSTKDGVSAVQEIKQKIGNHATTTLLYFASSKYDPQLLSSAMKESFSGSTVIGCTTAGELVSGAMLKQSVVAMALDKNEIADVCVAVVENIANPETVSKAFSQFEHHFGVSMRSMDITNHVGCILVDGLSCAEEKVMEKIGDLTDVIFIGGSAGDDLQFKKTYLSANGKTYTNAAVLILFKVVKGYDIIKTQSFKILPMTLEATAVNESTRTVASFNHKPAAQAYMEALGAQSIESLPNYFMNHPLGLMVGKEPYVRSPQRLSDLSMIFYCNVKEGMRLSLLESTDIVADTKKALAQKLSELGTISGIINFHCILRTLELEQKKQTKAYGELFSPIPTIGFSTYGEEYMGHINQTSTMLIFK